MKQVISRYFLLALTLAVPTAMAATQNITVHATVRGSCAITSVSDIDFGQLDPTSSSAHQATGNVHYWCTNGVTYTLALNDGLHFEGTTPNMKQTTGALLLPYTVGIVPTGGSGTGPTPGQTAVVTATITAADAQRAHVGDYEDTLTVSLEP